MGQKNHIRIARKHAASHQGLRFVLLLFLALLCLPVRSATQASATASQMDADGPSHPTESRKIILLLHTGHRGPTRTNSLSDALQKTLAKADPPPQVDEVFLDWFRYPDGERLELLTALLVRQYAADPPDAIIATGEKALSHALSLRTALGGPIPVIHAGVPLGAAYRESQYEQQVTGIPEILDIAGTAALMKALQPALQQAAILHDGSGNGLTVLEEALPVFDALGVAVTGIDTGQLSDTALRDQLARLPTGSAVLLASDTLPPGKQTMQPLAYADMVATASPVPVYSLLACHLGNGVVGGSLLDPTEEGTRCAALALRVLAGQAVGDLASQASTAFVTRFDWKALQRLHLNPSRLPRNVRYINRPGEFFRTYRLPVTLAGISFIGLLAFGLFMARSSRVQRHATLALKEREHALEALNERLRVSEEQLRHRNADLIAQEDKILHMAYHDTLTGLPNRTMLRDMTEGAIVRSRRENIRIGFYFIDTDNFKLINDSFGHPVGDQLLIQVARRLEALQETLAELSVARLGGDEFVLLRPLNGEAMLEETADSILEVFGMPFSIGELSLYLSCSIGVVLCPDQADNFEDLLRNADTSLYHAKATGRNRFVVFDRVIHQNVMVLSQMHQQIREAQKNNEFRVYYQPKCLPDGTVRGFEALMRWQSGSGDFIPPGRFIPAAEETGVILPLGDMVLRESCRFVKRLRNGELPDMTVSVNVSVIQLTGSGYLERVLRILEEEGVPRDAIVLEITESVLMESIDANVSRLEAMKAAGLRLSLDDFGTGYSSLTYLTHLPIEELKIDKSFIQQLDTGSVNASILSTVITLAGHLGLRTVAEGVETAAQRDFLVAHHCDLMQGFLFSPALPREEAIAFAHRRPPHPSDGTTAAQWGNEPYD